MTARHREPPSPDQSRYRVLLVVLVAIFIIAFFLLRVLGSGGDDGEPTAADNTTTTVPGDSSEGTDTDGDTSTSTPGEGGDGSTTTSAGAPQNLAPLEEVSLDLVLGDFQQPVALAAPDGDDRLFIVQRVGVIRIIDGSGVMVDPAFIDLRDRVIADGIERGLLGLDFHPDYANNGRFFVYYTDKSGNRQLSEFAVSATDPNVADLDTEKVIFEYPQPEGHTDIRHYGGNVVFGPDGYLWVSMGDGADSRDQGQDPTTPYGTIVRIDVDSGDPYSVPADNPFVGTDEGMDDVWAYGLRNPWRFSIDPVDGMIYIADVGHADQEEVNVVSTEEGGYNFGWSDMEGTRCFHLQDCNPDDYTSPVVTYTHEEGLSITGGFVYRGDEIPELHGTYFYSDWVSQWIRGFKFVDGQLTEEKDWTADLGGEIGSITSFGLDGHGEMYALTYEGGVYKFTAVRS